MRFNVGQYTLSMVAAWAAMRAMEVSPRLSVLHPFASHQLPAMLVAAGAFFLVNAWVVGTAVALYQDVPILSYFRNNLSFVVITGGVVLLVSPIVLAAAAYTVAIVPLCLAPVVAMYNSVHQSARNEHAARHDSLTGLPNRTAFHETITEAIQDEHVPAAVLLMDLDRFKEVNDTLGHRYGDLLLVQVAQRFKDVITSHGQIARLGGDEFAVISPASDRQDAVALAHRIADALSQPFELEEMVVDVQASVGIALFPEHGHGVEVLLQKADVAMYRAKETRSSVALYDERHDHHSPAKLALTAELRTAVDSEEIVLWYQPELDLRTREVMAVEALVRWDHPRLGVLPPSSFVRMAEATNLIKPLTQRVMEVALLQVADWHAIGLEIAVAVNISAQVLVDQSFTQQVVAALRRTGVGGDDLLQPDRRQHQPGAAGRAARDGAEARRAPRRDQLDPRLFARIDALYQQRDSLGLDAESARLLWRYHQDFVRAGAQLSEASKAKLRALNAELATLQTTFAQNTLKERGASAVTFDTRAELAGLSDAEIDRGRRRGQGRQAGQVRHRARQHHRPAGARPTSPATRRA